VEEEGRATPKGDGGLLGAEPRESAVWLVREVARFGAEGPHGEANVSFTPESKCFGLSLTL